MTKLLAATGAIGGGSSVEIVNLDESKPNLICDNLPNLPLSLYASLGGLLKGTPVICGGYSGQFEKGCNSFEHGAWKPFLSMTVSRYAPGTISFSQTGSEKDNILFVAAGTGRDGQTQSTVEAFDGINWNQTKYSNLPFSIMGNCMVKFNNSMLMSIGGSKKHNQADSTGETNVFDVIQNKWFTGPLLSIPRMHHFCEVLNWKNTTSGQIEKVIVVAGIPCYNNILSIVKHKFSNYKLIVILYNFKVKLNYFHRRIRQVRIILELC
jgi:hypothetical protein